MILITFDNLGIKLGIFDVFLCRNILPFLKSVVNKTKDIRGKECF